MRLVRNLPARNFGAEILRAAVRAVIALAVLLGAVVAAASFGGFGISPASEVIESSAISPLETRADPVQRLIAVHGCWTGEAPSDMAGKFPEHAIVGGKYVGKRLTDLAFDQEVGGHPHGLTVNAFCR